MGYDNKYIGRYGNRTPNERSTILQVSLKISLYVVSVTLAIALVVCYISPYISPTSLGSLTIVAIFSPIIYTSVVICTLLMIILKRWIMAGILLLLVLIGIPHLSKFYNIAFMRPAEVTTDRNSFTLMSYNVRGFYDDNGDVAVDDFVDYLERRGLPDILCIQEFASATEGVDKIDSLYLNTFKNYYVSECVEAGSIKLKTYSRFPFVAKSEGNISGLNSGTSAWVDVVVLDDTMRLFNNHLYTMSISESDSEDISEGTILQDGNRVRSIIDRIDNNSSIRAKHAELLKEVINSSPYSHIVCGDFNDTPMSYVYSTLSDGLNDAFIEHGTGYRSTFRPMRSLLCIDYILYSNGIKAYSYEADKSATLSDHLPLRVQFKILK
jgi:endonuclease/exonuclease/phosphatase family metal-dependent hydrolase